MALLSNVSMGTIILSAAASVVTSYVGTLLNFRRQRDRARRTYGLAILSEIKSLQRAFRSYHGMLGAEPVGTRIERLPRIGLTTADLNVFGFNSGNIGLFSIRTAVEVIDFYSRVRALIAQAKDLEDTHAAGATDDCLNTLLMEHLRCVVRLRAQSRTVATQLRHELPALPDELLRHVHRKARVRILLGLRRVRAAF